ncbi:MAG: hypothetical protein V4505_12745 [Pseudomonadota bacterium]
MFQEGVSGAEAQSVASQKVNAKQQRDTARRATEKAKQADLQLKQKRSQEVVAKLNLQ